MNAHLLCEPSDSDSGSSLAMSFQTALVRRVNPDRTATASKPRRQCALLLLKRLARRDTKAERSEVARPSRFPSQPRRHICRALRPECSPLSLLHTPLPTHPSLAAGGDLIDLQHLAAHQLSGLAFPRDRGPGEPRFPVCPRIVASPTPVSPTGPQVP